MNENFKILEVHQYYDGPLTGWCEYNNERYYFYWDDVDFDSGKIKYVLIKGVSEDFQDTPDDIPYEEYFKDYEKLVILD